VNQQAAGRSAVEKSRCRTRIVPLYGCMTGPGSMVVIKVACSAGWWVGGVGYVATSDHSGQRWLIFNFSLATLMFTAFYLQYIAPLRGNVTRTAPSERVLHKV
jgi:hypothetical protein